MVRHPVTRHPAARRSTLFVPTKVAYRRLSLLRRLNTVLENVVVVRKRLVVVPTPIVAMVEVFCADVSLAGWRARSRRESGRCAEECLEQLVAPSLLQPHNDIGVRGIALAVASIVFWMLTVSAFNAIDFSKQRVPAAESELRARGSARRP